MTFNIYRNGKPITLTPFEMAQISNIYQRENGIKDVIDDFEDNMTKHMENKFISDNLSDAEKAWIKDIIYDVVIDRIRNYNIIEKYIEGSSLDKLDESFFMTEEITRNMQSPREE